jgi:hypothetical protein
MLARHREDAENEPRPNLKMRPLVLEGLSPQQIPDAGGEEETHGVIDVRAGREEEPAEDEVDRDASPSPSTSP